MATPPLGQPQGLESDWFGKYLRKFVTRDDIAAAKAAKRAQKQRSGGGGGGGGGGRDGPGGGGGEGQSGRGGEDFEGDTPAVGGEEGPVAFVNVREHDRATGKAVWVRRKIHPKAEGGALPVIDRGGGEHK